MVTTLEIKGKEVLVDDEALDLLSYYHWSIMKAKHKWKPHYYVVASYKDENKKQKRMFMHRLIMGAVEGEIVDHINGNTLDNRLDNLRITSQRINAINRHHPRTSQYPGVCWSKQKNKWAARIKVKDKLRFLGYFLKEKDAGNAYLWALSQIEDGKEIPYLSGEKTSKYPNVYLHSKSNKWCGEFIKNKIRYCVGCFNEELEAYNAVLKQKDEVG
jgi:hypothetical protein